MVAYPEAATVLRCPIYQLWAIEPGALSFSTESGSSGQAASSTTANQDPGSTAVLPLSDNCLTALRLRAERQAAEQEPRYRRMAGPRIRIHQHQRHAYDPRNFARQFAVRCRKAGIRRIRVHDTRRTCGSLLIALDVHLWVAMQILRHSQITMTMEISSEVPTAKTKNALKRLGGRLDG